MKNYISSSFYAKFTLSVVTPILIVAVIIHTVQLDGVHRKLCSSNRVKENRTPKIQTVLDLKPQEQPKVRRKPQKIRREALYGRSWAGIVVHHSASKNGSIEGIRLSHVSRGWDGIGYHIIIGNGNGMADGELYQTPRFKAGKNGAHCKGSNDWIGICLIGDFTKTGPTAKQKDMLKRVVNQLHKGYLVGPKVLGHSDMPGAATLCPAISLDWVGR